MNKEKLYGYSNRNFNEEIIGAYLSWILIRNEEIEQSEMYNHINNQLDKRKKERKKERIYRLLA